MADYGLKITVDGQDVATAVDKNLVYSSKYNGMKIAKHANEASNGAVSHGLGYIPMFLAYRRYGGTKFRLDNAVPNDDGNPWVDSSNINFPNGNNYYFIFVDTAT